MEEGLAAPPEDDGQTEPRKRSQLRTWAWVSGGWLALEVAGSVVLASVTL
jgi:hypothetical protein